MNDVLKAVTVMLRAGHNLEDVLKKDIESYNLNTTEFGVLEYLFHKGRQPMNNLCQKLLMANSSMTYVIDKLTKKDFVKRVNDDKDRRMIYIELTDKGEEFIQSIFPNHQKTIEEIFSVLTEEEVNELIDLLKKVGYQSQNLKSKI